MVSQERRENTKPQLERAMRLVKKTLKRNNSRRTNEREEEEQEQVLAHMRLNVAKAHLIKLWYLLAQYTYTFCLHLASEL